MKLDSVMQLQAMNEMMKGQFDAYPISSVMVLGVAGYHIISTLERLLSNGKKLVQMDFEKKVHK